jgi:hypothetical protein
MKLNMRDVKKELDLLFPESYCANCGRVGPHEDPLYEEFLDGDNKPVIIEVCKHYVKQKIKKD